MRNKILNEAVHKNGSDDAEQASTTTSFKPSTQSKLNSRVKGDWNVEDKPKYNAFSKPNPAFSTFKQAQNPYTREEDTEDELFKTQTTTGINFDKYEDIPVEVKGKEVPEAINDFSDIKDLEISLKKNIARANYSKPTPVQKYAFPIVIAGRDLMACAQTGSGKTAGFLFPIIQRLLKEGVSEDPLAQQAYSRRAFPTALILAPTRELSTQIYDEARKFTFQTGLKTCVVYGGADPKQQIYQLSRGCHILVATPGRLVDLMERGYVTLAGVAFLVLDEADRMLDMGFEPQIRHIVEKEKMPDTSKRQTLMFSATFPKEIRQLAQDFLSNYIFLTVGRVGSTAEFIKQKFEYVEEEHKLEYLLKVITEMKDKCLVFVKTKKSADILESTLQDNGIAAISIHGDRTQREREDALRKFKKGQRNILVATDVAARGLDIDNVAQVINFDLPENVEDYVHRIGRTGRAGNEGIAMGFFNDTNKNLAKDLVEVLDQANQECPQWLRDVAEDSMQDKKFKKGGFGNGFGSRGRGQRGRGAFRGGRGSRGGFRGGFNNSNNYYTSYDNDE